MKKALTQGYIWIVIAMGLMVLALGIENIMTNNLWIETIFFVIMSIITESLSINMSDKVHLSLGFAIGLAAILIFNPIVASFIIFTGTLFSVTFAEDKILHIFNTSFHKRLFNACAYALTVVLAGFANKSFSGLLPSMQMQEFNIIGIMMTILVYIFVNVVIFSILFSMMGNRRFIDVVASFSWVVRNFVLLAPLGIMIALIYVTWGMFAVAIFFGPFLIARYSYKLYIDMKDIHYKTISALSHSLDARDPYTNGHSHRVAEYSENIAKILGLGIGKVDNVRVAGILHDIGKIGISDSIINKKGKLDDVEYHIIKTHPVIGEGIVNEIDSFKDIALIIRHHHERYDGKGYPDGLLNEEIPFESQILSVADSYDAMTSDRPYRKALTQKEAINILVEEKARQFHPDVVEAFVKYITFNEEN